MSDWPKLTAKDMDLVIPCNPYLSVLVAQVQVHTALTFTGMLVSEYEGPKISRFKAEEYAERLALCYNALRNFSDEDIIAGRFGVFSLRMEKETDTEKVFLGPASFEGELTVTPDSLEKFLGGAHKDEGAPVVGALITAEGEKIEATLQKATNGIEMILHRDDPYDR